MAAVVAVAPAHACQKTFSESMIVRAINFTYHGTRDVTRADRAHLRRYVRCARPKARAHRPRIRRYWHHARAAWKQRRAMYGPVLASWYALYGSGACGIGDVQSGYRFASLILPCGEVITMCHGARCVDAMSSDRGPYVGGRTFDLNMNLKAALGCPDLCLVRWRR